MWTKKMKFSPLFGNNLVYLNIYCNSIQKGIQLPYYCYVLLQVGQVCVDL